ncbi:hypothetical protein PIB30_047182 [Stylosanthes scabra]|uniref:PB1-like domain-containing protein n=1 Tax=Stylosanthes scabra TaxID=79078 RepID=A0ABU6QG50_9FABA|nr:hypothetical protein [Stylosanthes scabra]
MRHSCPPLLSTHVTTLGEAEVAVNGEDDIEGNGSNTLLQSEWGHSTQFLSSIMRGSFIRHPNGELVYANGELKRFDYCELDIDHINIGNLVVLLNELGYKNHKAMHWYDKNALELETGINEIDGDQGIRELIEWLRVNDEPKFHIYIEHTISKPILAEDVGVGEKVKAETVNLDEDSIHSWEMPKHVIHINS